MSSIGAAPRAAGSISAARAAASRSNGARSRGPKTAEGKARTAQNALKHGLCAAQHVVLRDEDWGEFRSARGRVRGRTGTRGRAAARARPAHRLRGLAAAARRAARGRAVRGAPPRGWQHRPRADPRRQRHALVRDAAALPQRGAGRARALPAHAQRARSRTNPSRAKNRRNRAGPHPIGPEPRANPGASGPPAAAHAAEPPPGPGAPARTNPSPHPTAAPLRPPRAPQPNEPGLGSNLVAPRA